MRPSILTSFSLLCLLLPAAAEGQSLPTPALRLADAPALHAPTPMSDRGPPVPITRPTVRRQQDDRPSVLLHVVGGAAVGGMVGALAGLYTDSRSDEATHVPSTLIGAVIGVPVGALGGLIVWSMRMTARQPR